MINNEQNTIIKIFSVLAVALMPPTLVGTIYGMNFKHIPELEWAHGYPFALRADGHLGGAALAIFQAQGMAVAIERDESCEALAVGMLATGSPLHARG